MHLRCRVYLEVVGVFFLFCVGLFVIEPKADCIICSAAKTVRWVAARTARMILKIIFYSNETSITGEDMNVVKWFSCLSLFPVVWIFCNFIKLSAENVFMKMINMMHLRHGMLQPFSRNERVMWTMGMSVIRDQRSHVFFNKTSTDKDHHVHTTGSN